MSCAVALFPTSFAFSEIFGRARLPSFSTANGMTASAAPAAAIPAGLLSGPSLVTRVIVFFASLPIFSMSGIWTSLSLRVVSVSVFVVGATQQPEHDDASDAACHSRSGRCV